jgi:hypothetical protein
MTRWASRSIASDGQFFQAISAHGPVSLISTPRSVLHCRPVDQWHQIENDRTLNDFDQIPLTSPDGSRVEAVFVRGEGRIDLNSAMFMAAEAPLLSFVETADQQRFRFLLDEGDFVGLVTLSDLQRLPVYALLFGLVIAVEMLLMEEIRRACNTNADAWLAKLSVNQRETIEKQWKDAMRRNVAIDRLSCASFGQEIQAAIGLGLFLKDSETHRRLFALKTLRDQVCHASEFAPTPELALQIPAQVRHARALANLLQDGLEAQSQ